MASEAKVIVGFAPDTSGLRPLDDEQDQRLTEAARAEIDRGDCLSEMQMDVVLDAMLADLAPE